MILNKLFNKIFLSLNINKIYQLKIYKLLMKTFNLFNSKYYQIANIYQIKIFLF